ncbi:response regulator [Tumidithrix elongata RA019]|uniref:Response regulator n=1 Tax=Tumidithrix elongata BACA0141 TaxID=2716417 RepID=A0AAW9PPZ4_9CYAN|nr:response regulator [Tumidithrix elongata RA019]
MQGTLREIDVNSIIRLIEYGQRSGELLIESSTGQFWYIFFCNGEIVYATDPDSNLTRLRDYLFGLRLDRAFEQVMTSKLGINVLEYGQIWSLLESNILSTKQAIAIVENMVSEVLFDVLSLHKGTFVFEMGSALSPQLTSIKFSAIASDIVRQIQVWKQFHPYIQSPHQFPIQLQPEAIPHLSHWIDGKTSIRQLARYSGQSTFKIAEVIYTAIGNGLVSMASVIPTVPEKIKLESPRIICIDDSMTICRTVEYILHNHGYQVAAVSSPTKALSLVFQLKPNLILCDITMPDIDGYELCAMLRKSSIFSQTPIIMLTGKDGFIDRVKARMVGATEYLTKPFGEKELLTIVEKYLNNQAKNSEFMDNVGAMNLQYDHKDF